MAHHAWRPVNFDVSHLRQFHLPQVLFTRLMKNWGVLEIIAGEFLHICQNFRGICKRIINDIFNAFAYSPEILAIVQIFPGDNFRDTLNLHQTCE